MESRPLLNSAFYERAREEILRFYFRDLDAENRDRFRPAFLLNDIVRYWRTICVNYEEKRTKYFASSAEKQDDKKKAKLKLKNKKLKFNRIWLCFTTLIPLVEREFWTPEDVNDLFKVSPFERLKTVCEKTQASEDFYRAADTYKQFLEKISSPVTRELLEGPNNAIWRELNEMASNFRSQIIKIIEKSSHKEAFTYLYI
jgi:hypothetical protein